MDDFIENIPTFFYTSRHLTKNAYSIEIICKYVSYKGYEK